MRVATGYGVAPHRRALEHEGERDAVCIALYRVAKKAILRFRGLLDVSPPHNRYHVIVYLCRPERGFRGRIVKLRY